MKKRILALLLTLALVLPAVSCDVLLADPNAPVTPSDSQSANNNTPGDTEKAPSKGPEVHTQPQTPPDSEPEDTEPNDWYDEPETEYIPDSEPPKETTAEPETEYIPKEFKVTFVLEGYDNEYGVRFITEGHTVGKPKVSIDPAIGSFDGIWYTDPHFKQVFDFGTYIAGDITLYGRFVPNPAAPELIIDAEALNTLAGAAVPNVQMLGSSEVITEGKYTFARWTTAGGDPYVAIIPLGSRYTLPRYMAISYRTNSTRDGQFFLGSGAGWTGLDDCFSYDWNENGEWNLAVVDLTNVGVTSIIDGLLTYCRMDFFVDQGDEGDYFDIAYIGFFNSPEYAQAYDFEKHKAPTWQEDQSIIKHVSFDQLYTGTDNADLDPNTNIFFAPGNSGSWNNIAILPDFSVDTLTYWGWVAYSGEFGQFGYQINGGKPVYNPEWAFIGDDHNMIDMIGHDCGGDGGTRMKIAISLAGLKGENTVRTLYKSADGIEVCLSEFTVILPARRPFEVPEHTEETVDLGIRGNGGPFSGMNKKKFGQRFNIGENFLKAINIKDMAAYANPVNTWAFRIWAWDTDYVTTTAAEPIYELTGKNHLDNTTFTVADLATYGITGDFYYEIEYVSGNAGFTGWKAQEFVAEGVQTYVAGELVEGTYSSSIVVGVPTVGGNQPETPDEPVVEYYDNLAVPQDQWVISGHRPQLQNSSDGMVAAAGVEYAALLHQGSIALGEIDLSKYSKVVIYWGSDNSQVTMDRYNENAHNRIMLLSVDMDMMNSPTEDTIIAGSTYTLHGWAVQAHEIDLTGIDYNGPVYVTWDTLPGSFMLISSVEFIGGEIR